MGMSTIESCTLFIVMAAVVRQVDCNAFLGPLSNPAESSATVSASLEKALLAEVEEVLGSEHRKATERRLGRIEEALRPTFAAMPKNEHGRLEHAAARYALHRVFVQRHGWFVRGLEPGGDAWNTSAATKMMPDYIQDLFERRIGGDGFDLNHLAALAALLENLVHHEAVGRLGASYSSLEISRDDSVSLKDSQDVIDTYMISYILGTNISEMSPALAQEQRSSITEQYPGWPDTQTFLREVQESVGPHKDDLTFENVASVVEEVGERYGRWQDHECKTLKNELVGLEDRGSGRVRVADFYSSALHDGKWQFSESVDYLRQLGALDETDPSNPRVLISNYVNSPSNCVASSSYYSVCCLNECEDLLGALERKLAAPDATPAEIVSLVASLPSATTPVGLNVSDSLRQRLEEVAAHHGGTVPMHGRLFSQWMHYAYPRECPYPHVTGTTTPRRAEDWAAETGQEVVASADEMRQHIEAAPARRNDATEENEHAMWTMEEELVVCRPAVPAPAARTSSQSVIRGAMFVVAVVSTALALTRTLGSALSAGGRDEKQQMRYHV